ncbi:LOW QUALITY PROTEIN: zinc finger protein 236-like isoform X1 [Vespula maculifrons]|uniref:Zinc finger protein 236-like isoform X1 n=1 Tax=Vespula maculifrons TaxID=7453 RepID=A0ABD2B5Z4_VESMC
MLTEQIVVSESSTGDTLPLGFITAEDGRTLLAVAEHEDGILAIMSTPVAFMQQNNIISPSLVKTIDGNMIVHPPIFQISIEGIAGIQQGAILPIQTLEAVPTVMEDVPSCVQSIVPTPTDLAINNKEQHFSPEFHTTQFPIQKNNTKRNPGRPRKNEVILSHSIDDMKCNVCGQDFDKQSLYRKHMDQHAEEKPHRCPKCSASFNIPTNFTLHMATHNTGEPKCPECGRKFARMASLKSHMMLHVKEENLFCTECEDAFPTKKYIFFIMSFAVDCINFALLLICSRVFHLALGIGAQYYKAQLDAHLKLHGEKSLTEEVRKCKLCNKQFVQPALYRLHIREHYKLRTKIVKQTKKGTKHKIMYKCTICLKSFQKPSQLMRHIRVHTGEKPFKCTVCSRAFTQKGSLQIHMWQHDGIRPHICTLCNARFSQKGNLNAHILRVHSAPEGESIYGCTYCPCIFKKLGSLNGHMKRMHSNLAEETSKCESSTEADMRATVDSVISQLASLESGIANVANSTQSGATIENRNDILQEALNNSGLPSKEKSSSNETIDSKKVEAKTTYVTLLDRAPDGTMRKYLTIKQRCIGNIRWYACSFCHKEFKKPSDLIRHLRVHTQEKPFKCSYCFRSFALKSTMIAHERTHTGTKKYACGSCDKTFACHSSLTTHTRLHTKPHKCTLCDKSFSSSAVLKSHMKSHSKGKSNLSPEAESLVPQIVLQEPLVISDAENIALSEEMEVSFQPQMAPDFALAFSDQFQNITEKEKTFLTTDRTQPVINSNLSTNLSTIETNNLATSQTLHTDETATITIPNYTGDQSLTPESIREIEETFNQQLFNIGMNLGLGSNLSRPIDDANTNTLEQREQPVLNIIYDNNKNLESSANTMFTSQFDSFDISQITLQPDTEIDIGLNTENSANMANILTRSIQERQELSTIAIENNTNDNHIKTPKQLMILGSKQTGSDTLKLPQSCSRYPKVIAKADTTDTTDIEIMNLTNSAEIQMINDCNKKHQENIVCHEHGNNTLHLKCDLNNENFQDTLQLNAHSKLHSPSNIIYADINGCSIQCDSLLQCHICSEQGFTTEELKEHLQTHRGTKGFQCTECSLKFCTSGGLSRHLKLHKNKEQWKCTICQQVFVSKAQLRSHNKMHDNNLNASSLESDKSQKENISINKSLSIDSTSNNKISFDSKTLSNNSIKLDEKISLDDKMGTDSSVSEKVLLDTVAEKKIMDQIDVLNHLDICDLRFRTSGHRKVHLLKHVRQHKGITKRKQKHMKVSAVAEASLDLEKSVESVVHLVTTDNDVSTSSNVDYSNLDAISIDTNNLVNQINLNSDTMILNNNSIVSLNENNQLVANLHFLLANGFVTIQTDDTSPPTVTTAAAAPAAAPTTPAPPPPPPLVPISDANIIQNETKLSEFVNGAPIQESYIDTGTKHVVITNETSTRTALPTTHVSTEPNTDISITQLTFLNAKYA